MSTNLSRSPLAPALVTALVTAEIVEGTVDAGRMHEVRRVDFTPKAPRVAR